MNQPAAQSSPPLMALPTQLRRGQGGTVLVVSLIILLLMTLIGVTAMNTTGLEEKMAANSRDRNFALQAAETALRQAEAAIQANCIAANVCGGLVITPLVPPLNFTAATTWINADGTLRGTEYGAAGVKNIAAVTADPSYFIEQLFIYRGDNRSPTAPPLGTFFRITARGTGSSVGATVIIQTTFLRKY